MVVRIVALLDVLGVFMLIALRAHTQRRKKHCTHNCLSRNSLDIHCSLSCTSKIP
jgi:hypothetical protein